MRTIPLLLRRESIAALLRRQAASFDRIARLASSRLTSDRVHDLRVLTRRMRAAVSVGLQGWPGRALRRLRRLLRRTGRSLGARRSLDVAAEDYRLLQGSAAPEAIEQPRLESGDEVL